MVLYVLETDGGRVVRDFFKEVEVRFAGGDLISNPFSNSVVKPINSKVWLVSFKPVYPPVYLFGVIWSVLSIVFGFGLWWLIPAVILFAQGFFFLSPFYVLFTILGLRKKGYKGRVVWLDKKEVIKRYL